MNFYKLLFHTLSIIKCLFFKIIYKNSFKVGKNVTWRKRFNVMIAPNANINIGNNCFFNNDCSLNCNNKIQIGNDTIFGENVKIYDHNHKFSENEIPIKEQGFSDGEVYIGNNCWIGSNVVILKGTKIGDNCVIGAGIIISTSISDGSIVKRQNNYVIEKVRGKENAINISDNGSV